MNFIRNKQSRFKKFATLLGIFGGICLSLTLYAHTKNDQIFNAIKKTHWFEQGNPHAAHQIYVLVDPNCSACHYFYESVRPYIARGQLTVRWVMVAFLKKSSLGKVLAIIGSKKPAQAFDNNETAFDADTETGGINPVFSGSSQAILAIKENINFMHTFGLDSTPIVLFKNVSGHTKIVKGALPIYKIPDLVHEIGRYKEINKH